MEFDHEAIFWLRKQDVKGIYNFQGPFNIAFSPQSLELCAV